MKTKFDSKTLSDWRDRSVSDVTVDFVAGGCAGTKISVSEGAPAGTGYESAEVSGFRMHFASDRKELLFSASVTKVSANGKTKWMIASAGVKSRCDCGSSFATDAAVRPVPKIDLSAYFAKKKARERTLSEDGATP